MLQPGAAPASPLRRRRRWPAAVAAALLVGAVGVGAVVAPSLLNRTAPAPVSTSTALPLVTATHSPQPTGQVVLTSGGDLGAPATFASSTGTGTLTVTRATWTQAGRMAPPAGEQYLVLEITVACSSGSLDVSSLSLRTTAASADQSAFGAELGDQFPGVRLSAGQQQSGQIGFVLPSGQTTLALLDPATLQPVANRVVPGP